MALDVYQLHFPDDIPAGHLAAKIIKAIYTDTKQSVFPCDGPYGKDWKRAISFLNRKRKQSVPDHTNNTQHYGAAEEPVGLFRSSSSREVS